MERIAGPCLRSVGLANCRGMSGHEPKEILGSVATCPNVEKIDVTGCTLEVATRTFAVRARDVHIAASPPRLELYEVINALQEKAGGELSASVVPGRSRFVSVKLCQKRENLPHRRR